ncbi:MAG: LysR family transcriptional regulator [Acidobacteriota bacterium]|nr:MAG: LysR family transcriptional regulator [Acidobacteriota bacterium]
MHLETLKTYCDLIETGSFSKAAALNYVTQSAVSQQVQALERKFDVKLIERGRRKGVAPTEAGRLMYAECKEIVERYQALEGRLRLDSEQMAGTIRIATVYSVGLHELPPYIKQFIKAYPQVKVHVEYSRTNKVYESCLNNSIDFGIVACPSARPQIEIIPVREETLVLICSPEHALAGRGRVSLRRLRDESFIGFERDIPTRKLIDRILKKYDVTVNHAMEFDNIETIKRSVEVGIGVSILPESAVVNEVRSGMLAALSFIEGNFSRPIGIIHRKGKGLSAAARKFTEQLVAPL